MSPAPRSGARQVTKAGRSYTRYTGPDGRKAESKAAAWRWMKNARPAKLTFLVSEGGRMAHRRTAGGGRRLRRRQEQRHWQRRGGRARLGSSSGGEVA